MIDYVIEEQGGISDGNSDVLWGALNLGHLLKSKPEKKVDSPLRERIMKEHDRKVKKPSYNVVIGRYKLTPTDPKILHRKTLNRLANPCKFSKPVKIEPEPPLPEMDEEEDENESYYIRTARKLDKLERRDSSWFTDRDNKNNSKDSQKPNSNKIRKNTTNVRGGNSRKDAAAVTRTNSIRNPIIGVISRSSSFNNIEQYDDPDDNKVTSSERGGVLQQEVQMSPAIMALKQQQEYSVLRADDDAKAVADAIASFSGSGNRSANKSEDSFTINETSRVATHSKESGSTGNIATASDDAGTGTSDGVGVGGSGSGSGSVAAGGDSASLITVIRNPDGSISVTVNSDKIQRVADIEGCGAAGPIVIELSPSANRSPNIDSTISAISNSDCRINGDENSRKFAPNATRVERATHARGLSQILRRTPYDRTSVPARRREREGEQKQKQGLILDEGNPLQTQEERRHRSGGIHSNRDSRKLHRNKVKVFGGDVASVSVKRNGCGDSQQQSRVDSYPMMKPLPPARYDDRGHIINRESSRIHPIIEEDEDGGTSDDASTGSNYSTHSRSWRSYRGSELSPQRSFKAPSSSLVYVSSEKDVVVGSGSSGMSSISPNRCLQQPQRQQRQQQRRCCPQQMPIVRVRDVRRVIDVRSGRFESK